jgi:hypothetical protein
MTLPNVASAGVSALAWIAAWNDNPRPFIWTKDAEQILEKLGRFLRRISGEEY